MTAEFYPNGVTPNLAVTDVYESRISALSVVTPDEGAAVAWRRRNYFIPINAVRSSGVAGDFGSEFTCTLKVRFQRPAGEAATFMSIADFNVYASDKVYASGNP